MKNKQLQIWGVLFCGTAVILGAFGAHLLSEMLSADALQSFEVGVRYQFFHGMALLFLSLTPNPQKFINRTALLFYGWNLVIFYLYLSFVFINHVWRYRSASYSGSSNPHWWVNAYSRMVEFACWVSTRLN